MRKAPRLSAPSRSLTAGSFTITNSQFCALLPVGALSASSITRSTSPSSTGSGLSRRIARWVRIASSSGIEKSGAAVGGAGLVSSMLGLLGADQSTPRARWKPARRLVYNPPHVARPARQGRRRRRRLHALRRALRPEPRGPPLRRDRRGALGCGLRTGAHRGGVGGHRHVHLRRRRARRRAQALRPPHDAGAELLRLGHGCLPQRLPRGRCRAARRRARRRLREDARRRLRAPQPEPPRARLRRAGAARLRALRAPLLRAVRRLQEDARRGGGQEPQERHEEPEGAFEDGGERGDGAGRAHDLQPPRSLRLLPDDRRRRGGGRLPRGPGAILHGHAGVAPGHRARGGLGPALLQAELRLPRLRGHGARRRAGLRAGEGDASAGRLRRGARLLHHHRDPELRGPGLLRARRGRQVRRGGARRSRRREAGEALGRSQVVRPPGGRDRRAHDLRAHDAAPRPGRRAAGEGRADRPRPQPGRPGRDLVRVDPDQPGVKRAAAAAMVLLALAGPARAADPPGSPRADQALAVCLAAAATPEERRANLARGLALAEEAVAADERDAQAHFARLCRPGNDVKLRGVAVTSLFAIRRLRREIDRTLELAPDYADALVGKGELLCELPRVLGGDAAEGERLLRAALRVDPGFIEARLGLVRALAARGERDEARAEARRALAEAERAPDPARATEARRLLAQLAE